MSLDYDAKLPPYTQSTALKAGWEWRIPLSHRVGAGYVFSSHFISDEAAAQEFVAHNRLDPDKADPKLLRMRIGRRQNFWIRNCLAVGLASGFIEPLESTGIYLIQKGASLLLDLFPDKGFNETLVRHYNHKMGKAYEEVRDFIIMHYVLTQREDTEFWKANRRTKLPDSLAATLELYRKAASWTGKTMRCSAKPVSWRSRPASAACRSGICPWRTIRTNPRQGKSWPA